MIFKQWHTWKGSNNEQLLSNEDTKKLRAFKSLDDCINWLYLNGHKEAARVFSKTATLLKSERIN